MLSESVPGSDAIVVGAAGAAGGDGPYSAGGLYPVDAGSAFPPAGDDPALPFARAPLVAEADLAAMLAGGIAIVVSAALMRRRHRRRIGWGMLPERQLFGRNDYGD